VGRTPSLLPFDRHRANKKNRTQEKVPSIDGCTKRMKTLIVIPTLNEAANIALVTRTLLTDVEDDVLLVVADGGSTDGTREIVARMADTDPRIVLLDNVKRIQSAGVNLAVERFGDGRALLIRCDGHSTYQPDFVRQLVSTIERTDAASVVVPMDSVGEGCMGRAIAWASDTRIGSGGSAHRAGRKSAFVDHGHHAAMRIDWFRRVGGYDESFTHNEDAEFDCRLRALGGTIYLDADARIVYRPRSTLRKLWAQYRNYGAGRSRTVRRHPASLRLRQFAVPAAVLAMALCIVASPLAPALLLVPAIYLAALAVTSVAVARSRRSLCGLFVGPAAATMHWSWAWGFLRGLVLFREKPWKAPA
jgi:succinoglycan biosynthesis protein ExoA